MGRRRSPTRTCPRSPTPTAGYLVTANNRIVGRRLPAPHHQRLPGRLPRQADRAADRGDGRARPRRLPADADRPLLDPRRRGRPPAGPPGAPRPARDPRDRDAEELGPASWAPNRSRPRIYQAFMLRLAREFARAAIGDRDLAERWLDRADNGFVAHVTSPWRWHSHLLALWEEGDEELIGRPLGRARPGGAARRASTTSSARFGPDPEGWRWGKVHELQLPPRARRAPTRPSTGSSTAPSRSAAARRRSPRSRTTPTIPTRRSGRRAGAWSPTPSDPERSLLAGLHRPVGPRLEPSTTTTCSRRWVAGQMQPMAGEGPWETLMLVPESPRQGA